MVLFSLKMCNVGDELNDTFPKLEKFIKKYDSCNKCRTEKPQVLLRNKDPYCKNCFLNGTTHKFKAFLGKNRLVNPNDKVLINYEGGHSTTALLHLLKSGLNVNTPKRLRFKPFILVIEDNFYLDVENRQYILNKKHEELLDFEFPTYFIPLTDYMKKKGTISELLCSSLNELIISDTQKSEVNSFFFEKSDLTSQRDILNQMRKQLLRDVAKHLNCRCIFTPELSINIASQLLVNVSLGRGAHLPLDIGICDDRDPEVRIIKPMRVFDVKEVAFYNILNGLRPAAIWNKDGQNPYSSIQSLVEKFVLDLQSNYPATVTTIIRTGDKLAVNSLLSDKKCILCQGQIEKPKEQLSSSEATEYSKLVSTHQSAGIMNLLPDFGNNHCYSCQRLTKYFKK